MSVKALKASRLGRGSTNGVYRFSFSERLWVILSEDVKPLVPPERYAVLYFDNTLCPVCRVYDESWYPFIESSSKDLMDMGIAPYIVLCDWFTQQCYSAKAALTFINYEVHASPTTIVMATRDGKVTYMEKYEGALSERDLREIVLKFPERALSVENGRSVERPLTESDMLRRLEESLSSGGAKGS